MRGRAVRRVSLLSVGKYRADLYYGFQCGDYYFCGAVFTAILSRIFLKNEEKLGAVFFAGFLAAMAGIALISFNGSSLHVNPLGDLLALLAAFLWASYSIFTKKISGFGYHTILTTRRTFFYGILFMIPALFIFDFRFAPERFANPVYLFNILFLGLGASALCLCLGIMR